MRSSTGVSPGILVRYPFLMAFSSVLSVGEKSAAWENVTLSAAVGIVIVVSACAILGKGIFHSLVPGGRWP